MMKTEDIKWKGPSNIQYIFKLNIQVKRKLDENGEWGFSFHFLIKVSTPLLPLPNQKTSNQGLLFFYQLSLFLKVHTSLLCCLSLSILLILFHLLHTYSRQDSLTMKMLLYGKGSLKCMPITIPMWFVSWFFFEKSTCTFEGVMELVLISIQLSILLVRTYHFNKHMF